MNLKKESFLIFEIGGSTFHRIIVVSLKPLAISIKIGSFGNEYVPTPAKTSNKIIKYRSFDLDKKSHDCPKCAKN